MAAESRSWFEKGIFELGIAQAHLLSQLPAEAAAHARQAALKFLQAVVVRGGGPEPSPRIADLSAAAKHACPDFHPADEWQALDEFASKQSVDLEEAKVLYASVEAIRDEVARVIG